MDTNTGIWRRWLGLTITAVMLGSGLSVAADVAVAPPTADAWTVPPLYECTDLGGGFVVSPGGPGTDCVQANRGGASLSPTGAVVQWGQAITFTASSPSIAASGVGWNATGYGPVVSGCLPTDVTCTIRYEVVRTLGLTGHLPWQFALATMARGESGWASFWGQPDLFTIGSVGRTANGDRAQALSWGAFAVRAGTSPQIKDCYVDGNGPVRWDANGQQDRWTPDSPRMDCARGRAVNIDNGGPALNGTVEWGFIVPPGDWDLYYCPQAGPPDQAGTASPRQATPWSVEHVTITNDSLWHDTILTRRPSPTVKVEVQGQQPAKIGDRRTVKVTVDAGPADSNTVWADTTFTPSTVALTSSDPSVVKVVGGGTGPAVVRMFNAQQQVYAFEVEALAEGTVQLASAIRSTDDLGIVTTSTNSAGVEARVIRSMEVQGIDRLDGQQDQAFTLRQTLVNTGNIDLNDITLTWSVDPTVPGAAELNVPSPVHITSLAAGASTPISIGGTLRDSGATLKVVADGTSADGVAVSANKRLRVGATPTSFSIQITAPRTVELAPGDQGLTPQPVDVVLTIANTGSAAVDDIEVLNGGLPTITRGAGVTADPITLVDGPGVTNIGSLAAGETRDLTFHFSATDIGKVNVGFAVRGTSDGSQSTFATSQDIEVTTVGDAEITWEMKDRYVAADDVATDFVGAHPTSWTFVATVAPTGGCTDVEVTLDARANAADDWHALGEVPTAGHPCELTFTRDNVDAFDLRATITRNGIDIGEAVQRLEPKDIVLVSLGDSMSSGEGAKDPDTGWTSPQCNRSGLAGPSLAAMAVENDQDPTTDADRHSTVTFVHLACSGASTYTGLIGPYAGVDPGAGGALPPQIYGLAAILGNRKVDGLMLTAGINDLPFSKYLKFCSVGSLDCGSDTIDGLPMGAALQNRIETLPTSYLDIDKALRGIGVAPSKVYLLEYPDPSRDDNGDFCDSQGVTPAEYQFLDASLLTPLNAAGATAAARYGWNRVGGIASAFRTHGLCSSQPWSNTILESVVDQHSIAGGFHPNVIGHQVFGSIITAAISDGVLHTGAGAAGGDVSQLTTGALAGATEVALDNDGFAIGDVVTLNPGAANQETRRIVGKGSLIFDQELQFDHGPGELIALTSDLPPATGANRPPVAVDDQFTVAGHGIVEIAPLANDSDPDGDPVGLAGIGTTGNIGDAISRVDGTERLSIDWSKLPCAPFTFHYSISDPGGSTSTDATVTVTPVCATLEVTLADGSLDEGTSVTLTPTVIGVQGALATAWDVGDDGTIDSTASTYALSAADGPSTVPVRVTVTDAGGATATTTATFTVRNVAPRAGTLTAPAQVLTNRTFTVSVGPLGDVAGDPLVVSFDCGTGTFAAPSPATTATCRSPRTAGPVTLRAKVDDGDGGITTVSATVTVVVATVPGAPSGLVSTPGLRAATISWTPAADHGAAITDHQIQRSADGGLSWHGVDDGVSTATTATVTLRTDTTYLVRVRARNLVGWGPWSTTVEARTWQRPAAPTGLVATSGSRSVTLRWAAPADGGAAISDYSIQRSTNGGASWATVNDGVSITTTFTVTSLTKGTTYTFRVRAVNCIGSGAWSATVGARAS